MDIKKYIIDEDVKFQQKLNDTKENFRSAIGYGNETKRFSKTLSLNMDKNNEKFESSMYDFIQRCFKNGINSVNVDGAVNGKIYKVGKGIGYKRYSTDTRFKYHNPIDEPVRFFNMLNANHLNLVTNHAKRSLCTDLFLLKYRLHESLYKMVNNNPLFNIEKERSYRNVYTSSDFPIDPNMPLDIHNVETVSFGSTRGHLSFSNSEPSIIADKIVFSSNSNIVLQTFKEAKLKNIVNDKEIMNYYSTVDVADNISNGEGSIEIHLLGKVDGADQVIGKYSMNMFSGLDSDEHMVYDSTDYDQGATRTVKQKYYNVANTNESTFTNVVCFDWDKIINNTPAIKKVFDELNNIYSIFNRSVEYVQKKHMPLLFETGKF